MSGYTPAFGDIYMGTLYGKWPAAPVWASLLPLMDKNGVVDMSLQAIAGMTGWPMDLLQQGIEQLSQPDPGSRSGDEDGRRLVPLDADRPWGWRAVNHGKYKEKARLMSKNSREVEAGRNRDRMKDRRRPPETAADPLSNTNTDANTDTGKEGVPPSLNSAAWGDYLAHRKELKAKRLTDRGIRMAMNKLAELSHEDQQATVNRSIENGWTGLFPEKQREKTQRTDSESFTDIHARVRKKAGLEEAAQGMGAARRDVRQGVLPRARRRADDAMAASRLAIERRAARSRAGEPGE